MTEKEMEEEISFAELLESVPKIPGGGLSPGDTVSGVVVKISKDTVFVDLGGKSEGIADVGEFRDPDGKLTVKEGDEVVLKVASVRKGIHLSKVIRARGAEAVYALQEAYKNQIPVEGRVAAVNKGGFDVDLSGIRAFCPISQIDLQYCEKPELHVGERYQFQIMEFKEKGKNIILSRRVLLQEERDKKGKETLATLKADLELEGQVTKLAAFGVFVDIGGIEGLVHISEISRGRIGHPSEVLEPGQIVKVKVLKMEPDKTGRPKISLSMKALEPEAWEMGFGFQEGDVISGKVSRLADFGAFIEVAPGVDGLVHVSEISYERISHPSRVLKEGDPVEVMVLKIDEQKRRISLSIREAVTKQRMAEYGENSGEVPLEVGQVLRGIVEDHKPYGLFVRLPQIGMKTRGLLPLEELLDSARVDPKKKLPQGEEICVEVIAIDEKERIRLSQKVIKEKEDREDYKQYIQKKDKTGKLGTLGEIFNKLKK